MEDKRWRQDLAVSWLARAARRRVLQRERFEWRTGEVILCADLFRLSARIPAFRREVASRI